MSDEPAKGTLLAKVVTKFLAGGSAVDVGESVVESFFRDVIGFGSCGGYVGILSSFVSITHLMNIAQAATPVGRALLSLSLPPIGLQAGNRTQEPTPQPIRLQV